MTGRGTLAAALLLLSTPVAAEVLWQGAVGTPCRLRLESAAAVAMRSEPGGATAELVGEGTGLGVAVAAEDQWTVLVVTPQDVAGAGFGENEASVALRVPTACEVVVQTEDAAVSIDLAPSVPALTVQSVTGPITLFTAPAFGATVHLATSGEITVDYSVDVEFRYHAEPAKQGSLVIGDGVSRVELHSRQGAVRVLRHSAKEPPAAASH